MLKYATEALDRSERGSEATNIITEFRPPPLLVQ